MPDEVWRDFVHTGPGTVAGRYLRLFWQPIFRSADLAPGQAVPIRIMSEDFTLYRGELLSGETPHPNPLPQGGRGLTTAPASRGDGVTHARESRGDGATPAPLEGEGGEGGEKTSAQASLGTAHLVAFRCAHRGTQLSVGWVEGECIRCRYHGWMYDASGQCVEQPGEDVAFAQRVRIRSYPTQEYLGLIFAYLGEGEPPPMRRFAELEGDWLLDATEPQLWACNYFNRVENDPSHVPFTHRESARRRGNSAQRMVRKVESEETAFGVRSVVNIEDGPPQVIDFHMPNVNQVKAPEQPKPGQFRTDGRSRSINSLFWRVPVDDEHCISFAVELIPLIGEAAEGYREQQRALKDDPLDDGNDWRWSDGILAGKMALEDVDVELSASKLFWMEDYVTQVGQGAIPDRAQEHLVQIADESVVLKRAIWQRELRALAEGRPLKQWTEAEVARS